jgi:hypothetical protein
LQWIYPYNRKIRKACVDYLSRVPSRRTFDRRLSTTISPGDNKNRITAIMGVELFICDKK